MLVDLWCFMFVFLLMSDELMLVNSDCELNLRCLWVFFFFFCGLLGFVTLFHSVFVTLSLVLYKCEREREREFVVEISFFFVD